MFIDKLHPTSEVNLKKSNATKSNILRKIVLKRWCTFGLVFDSFIFCQALLEDIPQKCEKCIYSENPGE